MLRSLLALAAPLLVWHASVQTVELPSFVPEVHVLFGGDMMFDRSVRGVAAAQGGDYLFSCIDPTLRGADFVVANLEGPITTNASLSASSTPGSPNNFVFTFPPSTAALLASHHVGAVNLGNNHILNWGVAGVVETMQYLRAAGVLYFGQPALAGDSLSESVLHKNLNGVHLAFITYNEFDPAGSVEEASTTLAHIASAKAAGEVPVVYTHWGVEYATSSPARIHALAHEFAEAGAALVIGSHPHVVEEHEEYKGVPIYYSLGNFIFDQFFSTEVDHGLLLKVTLTQGGVARIEELPITIGRDRRPCLTE